MLNREYKRAYLDFCAKASMEHIYGKELLIIYDDILPDLYVNIDEYKKVNNGINYDIYADRLKKVTIMFPRMGEVHSISRVVEKEYKDCFYDITWQEPMITVDYLGMEVELSLIDLMERGIKVYIEDYDFEFKGVKDE